MAKPRGPIQKAGEEAIKQAKRKGMKDFKFKRVRGDLNLWQPKKAGETIGGVVTAYNPKGPYGLQVKIMDPAGEVWTLPSHKVLQSRIENIPGGVTPGRTVLYVEYTGVEESKNWPTPMEMYEVDHAERNPNEPDVWLIPVPA